MIDPLTVWANWATILATLISLVSLIVTILMWIWKSPSEFIRRVRPWATRILIGIALFSLGFLLGWLLWVGSWAPNAQLFIPDREKSRDFEIITDKEEWTEADFSLLSLSTEQSFSGNQSLAISTSDTTNEPDQVIARWNKRFTDAIIVGHVYWPDQQGVEIHWAQVCADPGGHCRNFPTEIDRWNSFVISYYGLRLNDIIEPHSLYIQAGIKIGGTGSDTYTFFLDGIQILQMRDPSQ